MKTAISIPDPLFERAERQAAALGVSRSEFYSSAVERYLAALLDEATTRQIDEVLDRVGDTDDSNAVVAAYSRRRLALDLVDEW